MKRITILLGGLFLSVVPQLAWADCTPGSSICGADGKVWRCKSDGSGYFGGILTCAANNSRSSRYDEDESEQPDQRGGNRGCTPGSSICGADGKVWRCKSDGSGYFGGILTCR